MVLLLAHFHGSTSGAHRTATQLALLAIGLPGYCAYLLAIRALQSMRDTRTAFILYLVENGLNVALAFLLTSALGAPGLALSLSIAYTVAAVGALVIVRRRMGSLGGRSMIRYVSRSFLLSVLMGVIVALVATIVGSSGGLGLAERVGVSVVVGVVVYGGGAVLAATAAGWQTSGGHHRAARRET
jgi:putative peptidoglycan lipid II flippase